MADPEGSILPLPFSTLVNIIPEIYALSKRHIREFAGVFGRQFEEPLC